jgi:hypothetical protein
MENVFDYFTRQEIPTIILCNPNRIPVASLKASFNIENTLRFNAISELEFDFPKSVDNGLTTISAYSKIKTKMVVLVKDIGYYTIVECPENAEGMVPVKHVTCQSLESQLLGRRLTGFTMTSVQVYNYDNPDSTILNLVLKYYPGWTVGYVDPDLMISPTTGKEVRREFEIDNSTLYNFLISKAETSYNCVFTFDTINRKVNAYSIPNLNSNIGIFFSFNNINNKLEITEYSDELCTCLYAFGKDDLDIARVNSLGTNAIYRFDYFKTIDWMEQELVDKVTIWENKVSTLQPIYANDASLLYQYNLDLAKLNTDLINNQAELEGLQTKYSALIAGKLSTVDILNEIKEKYLDVSNIRVQIGDKKVLMANIMADLKKINAQLRFTRKNNFQKFSADLNNIYSDIKGLSSGWKTIFNINSTDPVIIESNLQLDYDTPTIESAFGNAIASLDKLMVYAKNISIKYPLITDEDIQGANDLIAVTTEYFDFLYTIFDGYISQSDISVGIKASKILLNAYVSILAYESTFTEDQYIQLQDFIYENTYTNKNISLSKIETVEFNEGQAQSLYDAAFSVLQRSSKPRFEISGEFVNILAIPEYSNYIKKLALGKVVNIEVDEGKVIEAMLLEIKFTYDDPTSFEMTFSNRVRLNNSNFQFADYLSDTVEKASGVTVS